MDPTPISLLARLRRPADAAAWDRLVQLYTPLLYSWARRLGLQESDAADLVQDVFLVLVRKLPEFQYDADKSFRAWLRTVLLNRWRDRRPALPNVPDGSNGQVADQHSEDGRADEEERAYRDYLVGRALQLVRPEFTEATWQAFSAYAIQGQPVADVARNLKVTPNTVYLAKSRVVSRLRQELDGFLR